MATATIETDAPARELQRMELEFQALPKRGVVTDKNTGDVTFWAVAVDTKKEPNRKGWVFKWARPADVDVDNLRANPVLLYLHESGDLPVGRIDQIEVTSRQVLMHCVIPGEFPELDQLRRWVAEGLLRAVSIGFYIDESIEHPKLNDVFIIHKFEIVELSLCPIGAHETALIQQAFADAEKAVGGDGADHAGRLYAGRVPHWHKEVVPAEGRVLHRLSLDAPKPDGEAEGELNHEDTKGTKADPAEPDPDKGTEGEADPPAETWADVGKGMAVVLGARGGMKSADETAKRNRYERLAEAYTRLDRQPPAYGPYTDEELKALHGQGVILYPGMPEGADTQGDTETERTLQEIKTQVEALTQRVDALDPAERQASDAAHGPEAEPTPTPPPAPAPAVDEQTLRYMVRAILASDEKCRADRQSLVEAVVGEVRQMNLSGRA